jgi:putative ABC transport system substrate-binding protein
MKRLIASLAATVAVVLAQPCAAANEPAAPYASWFKYDAPVTKAWTFTVNPADSNELTIEPKTKRDGAKLRKVLVMYPRASSAYDTAISKILTVFDSKELNTVFIVKNFNLDNAKARAILNTFDKEKYDLVFTMGSEATAWLFDNYRNGTIPVVSVCSKDPVTLGQMKDYDNGSGSNWAFTSLNAPIDVQMGYVKDLKPELKNIAVLVDLKNISALQTQAEPMADYSRKHGINFIWGSVKDPKTAKEELVTIVANAVAEMRKNDPDLSHSLFWITGSTSVFKEIQTINKYADKVPVVSVVPEIVSPGANTAVLSVGTSFESNAHLAAIYGADVLENRAKVGELKVGVVSPPDIAISFLKAREIGMRVPFHFFETATFIYDYEGRPVRSPGEKKPVTN